MNNEELEMIECYERENQRRILEQEIMDLTSDLTSPNSEIGDWKLMKIMEYQTVGLEPPYDINDYHEKRKAARDRINEVQDLLKSFDFQS